MTKFLWIGLLVWGAIGLNPTPSLAQTMVRQIASSAATGQQNATLPTIELSTGYGLTLNFIPTGEVIRKVWLDDPSQVGMDFDTNCPRSNGQEACEMGAMVIYLRRIVPITFPQLLKTGNHTMLTVITQNDSQQKVYRFQLVLKNGTPQYVTVNLVPDASSSTATRKPSPPEFLSALKAGLQIAEQNQQISRQQHLWSRLTRFENLVQRGMTIEQASQEAGVSLAVVNKLAEMGRRSTPVSP
ncbi:MAG: hypothetical protein SFW36_03100 [Leptolyngbyaceae cyanobacterium bins.59]|nr:hypothetical protein [Leptolyngbyaceae cyanobacterium bins.59]